MKMKLFSKCFLWRRGVVSASFCLNSVFALAFALVCDLQAQERIDLYAQVSMPNSRGLTVEDKVENERTYQVAVPYLQYFRPSKQENKRAAVVIIPGGGYAKLAHEISGTQIAKWFNTMGVQAFVLYHRLPGSEDLIEPSIAPLQDAQRALQIVRSHADLWEIDGDKIGVMGFSAGGHLAAMISTEREALTGLTDAVAGVAFRPDFSLLVSPVISMTEIGHAGSRKNLLGENPPDETVRKFSCELRVSSSTPPAFLVHADDDPVVPAENSLRYFEALRRAGVPASLHVFPAGAHGIALRNNPGSCNQWTQLCEAWLIESGFLK